MSKVEKVDLVSLSKALPAEQLAAIVKMERDAIGPRADMMAEHLVKYLTLVNSGGAAALAAVVVSGDAPPDGLLIASAACFVFGLVLVGVLWFWNGIGLLRDDRAVVQMSVDLAVGKLDAVRKAMEPLLRRDIVSAPRMVVAGLSFLAFLVGVLLILSSVIR